MRILHTADWHLGHRLYNQDRTLEHRAALNWLLRTVEREAVDLVVIAGDVFDVTNPSNQAKELYYEFLGGLVKSSCSAAVVVGGNHDSPSLLEAPRAIMHALQLYVVGAAASSPEEQIISVDCGGEKVLVAAVPYLRERDLRTATFGERHDEREQALRQGIVNHFTGVAAAAKAIRGDRDLPIIATGHLFASGASDNEDKKSYIYQANEHNILAEQFPACFDYVALGHIHRAQRVGRLDHVRYAGSLIPLTFVEGQVARSVRIVEIGRSGQAVSSRKLPLPTSRTLLRLRDTFAGIKIRLAEAVRACKPADPTAWAEVRVLTDDPIPRLREKLNEIVESAHGKAGDAPVALIRVSRERLTTLGEETESAGTTDLDELLPEEVFDRLCAQHECSTEAKQQLSRDFVELRNWMDEREEA